MNQLFNMALNRNQQHYIVMIVIYDEIVDYFVGGGKTFRDARELTSELCGCPYDDVDDFIKSNVANALQHYGEIRDAFVPHLVNWKWERLPNLTQAILLMSYAHFYYVEKVEKSIVINIAVDLAKKYIEEKQASFINAILDEVLK